VARQDASSVKKTLEIIADRFAGNERGIDSNSLFKALVSREKLGSTGLGSGVAIPHCRIKHCTHPVGVLLSLNEGVDFAGVDDQPTDLVFALIVPAEENRQHLQALQSIVSKLKSADYRDRLRQAPDDETLYREAIS